MSIQYPYAMPATPAPASVTWRRMKIAGLTRSPFDRSEQKSEWPGEWLEADVVLPPMARAAAEEWVAWQCALRGLVGNFLFGDKAGATPLGAAPGNPASVDGGAQSGKTLNTLAWTASSSGILLPGDWIQICKNYLTYPRSFDNAAWIKSNCSATSTTITAPNGVAEATELTPSVDGAFFYQQPAAQPSIVGGKTFNVSVWAKCASGTHSVTLQAQNQASVQRAQTSMNLTTSWQKFTLSATMNAADTAVRVVVGGASWTVAAGAFDFWGFRFYCSTLDGVLKKNLTTAASDSSTKAALDIFPQIRTAPNDFSAILTSSAVGLFRLADNQAEWTVDVAKNFGIGFKVVEDF